MSEFALYLSNSDSENRKNPCEFLLNVPKSLAFEISWECALLEISISCNITLKRDRLYLLGDFLEEQHINQLRAPVLRNVEIPRKSKKYLNTTFTPPIYVPVRRNLGQQLRFQLLDDRLQRIDEDYTVYCVLHFRRRWVR